LNNTIVADNHDVSLAGPGDDVDRLDGGGTLNARNSLFQTTPAAGTINGLNLNNITGLNPQLGLLKNNGGLTMTHSISPSSPAVNKGDVTLIAAPDNVSDQRGPGFHRVIGGAVDIGAYEAQPPADTITISSAPNPSLVGQTATFTATVMGNAANSNIPLGTVMFFVDGAAVATVALNNGVAVFATAGLAVGAHNVFALYNPAVIGDYTFNSGASSVLVHTVVAPPPPNPQSPIGRRWRR
jgi:hypothetical protein